METLNFDGLSACRLRGPHLARLELIRRFSVEDEPIRRLLDKINLGTAIDLIINYVLRFYAKPCCYNDVAQYLLLLNDTNQEELIDGLKEFIDSVIHQREQAGEDSATSVPSDSVAEDEGMNDITERKILAREFVKISQDPKDTS